MKQHYQLCNFILLLIGSIFLSGCSQQISQSKMQFVVQSPADHLEQEVMLERISQVLLSTGLNRNERAAFHFERGVIYDSLGLWTLARNDFELAVKYNPNDASAYNYLGLYSLLEQDYDQAIELFNHVLELDHDYEYAFLNRGLAFYYGQRYFLAEKDFLQFYALNKSDPYRTLWLYWNDLKQHPKQAKNYLQQRVASLDDAQWGTILVQYFLGKLSGDELLQQALQFANADANKFAEVLTETYFYLAKQQLNLAQTDQAEMLFKWAMANQVYDFVEYRFALFELMKLSQYSNK